VSFTKTRKRISRRPWSLSAGREAISDRPSSIEETKTWAEVLQAFEKASQVDLDIEQRKKELGH